MFERNSTARYQRDVARTVSRSFHDIDPDILHAALGVASEAGEFADPVKKAIFYGKPVDLVNMDEEVGDILWYLALYCNTRGIIMGELMDRNIAKLRKRYPEKFTEDGAIARADKSE